MACAVQSVTEVSSLLSSQAGAGRCEARGKGLGRNSCVAVLLSAPRRLRWRSYTLSAPRFYKPIQQHAAVQTAIAFVTNLCVNRLRDDA